MRRSITWGTFAVIALFVAHGVHSYATVVRCEQLVSHISAVHRQGDLPIAKLLIDQAVAGASSMGFSRWQGDRLLELRDTIYKAVVFDCLRIAREKILEDQDGIAALAFIARAYAVAEAIEMEVEGDALLWCTAYYAAGKQTLKMAKEAEDPKEAADLYLEAEELFRWARAFREKIDSEQSASRGD